jgi:enamine deaminase RidA (YjgF/YER057c/UK114 family)
MKALISILFFAVSIAAFAQKSAEQKVEELKLELFTPPAPMANYVRAVRVGNLLFLAGHGPTRADGTNIQGKVGVDLTIDEGYQAARQVGIAMLSTIKNELGSLDKVKRLVKVTGWVNCPSDFKDQPRVMNGYSDLMVAVFGEKGKHARAALGANALPSNISVEVEMILEIED